MGKGLLSSWRRRIVARGIAGAVLLAVPVAVAAAIGFGTSLSGVAGGLSAVTSGPSAVTASQPTRANKNLNHAVLALASRSVPPGSVSAGGEGGGGSTGGGGGSTGTGGGSGFSIGTGGGSAGGGSTSQPAQQIQTPSAPDTHVPGGGSTGGTTGSIGGTVNNVIGGVNDTANGLLGSK